MTGLQLQTLSQKCNGVDKLYISASFNKTTLSTKNAINHLVSDQCTEVHFDSLFSGGFTTMAVINPPERKLTKRTSVQWGEITFYFLRKVPILRRILFKEHS